MPRESAVRGRGAGLESEREKSGSLPQLSALGLLGNLGGSRQGSRQAVGMNWCDLAPGEMLCRPQARCMEVRDGRGLRR